MNKRGIFEFEHKEKVQYLETSQFLNDCEKGLREGAK
jgi:hypothetical protein